MDYAEEIARLKDEIEEMKAKMPRTIYTSFYKESQKRIRDYYENVKLEGQDYVISMRCEEAARNIIKYQNNLTDAEARRPTQYIDNEQKASSYFSITKYLIDTCQSFIRKEVNL